MSNGQEGNSFRRYAPILQENGFTVTPTIGKRPLLRMWQNPKRTDPDWLGRVVAKPRYAACNIGIVCGRVVGIDIDAVDFEKSEQIQALAAEYLGPTGFKRVGRAPRILLLYRPTEHIDSIKIADCIDVLSYGKQFVAFGIHPDTRQPYQWSGPSPETTKIDELPVITQASLEAFAAAVAKAMPSPTKALPPISTKTVHEIQKSNQRARQGEMLGAYDARIVRNETGLVIDGREAHLAKLSAAEYAKHTHNSPDDLANRVWARFLVEADLSRPKGSNPRKRWSLKDAQVKARAICRRNPPLKPPRRSRGGHSASHLNGWRRPGFWTVKQRELHLAEVSRRISTPTVLAVGRVMIEAVNLADGFCTSSIADIANRASCSTKSVTKARAALVQSALWISGPGGVFVPVPLNRNQVIEKRRRTPVEGNTKVPCLYHLSVVSAPLSNPLTAPKDAPVSAVSLKSYQPDLFGGQVIDLDEYRRGRLPPNIAASVRAEMRARGVTQDELAIELGISQPQLANALAGRFGLSQEAAARLLAWLQRAA